VNSLLAELIILAVAVSVAVAVAGYATGFFRSTMETNPVRAVKVGMDSTLYVCSTGSYGAVLAIHYKSLGTAGVKIEEIGIENQLIRDIEYAKTSSLPSDPCAAAPASTGPVTIGLGESGWLLVFIPVNETPGWLGDVSYVDVYLYASSGELYLAAPVVQT